MTPEAADQRIKLSQQTLSRYLAMTAVGVDPAQGTVILVDDEIAILERIGEAHPGKVATLVRLVSEWVAFHDKVKGRLLR